MKFRILNEDELRQVKTMTMMKLIDMSLKEIIRESLGVEVVEQEDNISIVVDMLQSVVNHFLDASTKEVSNRRMFDSWFHTVYLE